MDSSSSPTAIRRLIYTSTALAADLAAILRQSRTNNGIDGISGLLTFGRGGFAQVLEGPPESVEATFERIQRDSRHTDVRVVSDSVEPERVFGGWTMASLPGELEDLVRDRLARLMMSAPMDVRDAFERA